MSKRPSLAVDLIIQYKGAKAIILVERKNEPRGWALPGGMVEYGESLETAAVREAKEETGLDVRLLRQFHTYSEPDRDPRRHVVSTVYVAQAEGDIQAGSDAKRACAFPLDSLPWDALVFDHSRILQEYLTS